MATVAGMHSDVTSELPHEMQSLFWDCDFASVRLDQHRSFIIRRILDRGDWDAITWLRRAIGDDAIRGWFLEKSGHGLDPRKLRFWGLILGLPTPTVDEWVQNARKSSWHGRHEA